MHPPTHEPHWRKNGRGAVGDPETMLQPFRTHASDPAGTCTAIDTRWYGEDRKRLANQVSVARSTTTFALMSHDWTGVARSELLLTGAALVVE